MLLDTENDLAGRQVHRREDARGVRSDGTRRPRTASSPPAPCRLGFFLVPDGASLGAVESLCRRAVRNVALGACVDQLVTCAGAPHALQARADKGWLRAYLGMTADPNLRFHQAFAAPDGIDAAHAAFDPLRVFLQTL